MRIKTDNYLKKTIRSVAASLVLAAIDGNLPTDIIESLELLIAEIKRQNNIS